MRLLIGSGNPKKEAEIAGLLAHVPVELVTPADLVPPPPPPEETGLTFEANAEQKALAYAEATGLLVLADDSGLIVDALDGRPGVRSARFAGDHATDADNNARLLEELEDVPELRRGAAYACIIVVAEPGRVLLTAQGTCRGRILGSGRGQGGFGYDPLFFYPPLGRTFAEITPEEKARVSHRGQALSKLRESLPAVLQQRTHRT